MSYDKFTDRNIHKKKWEDFVVKARTILIKALIYTLILSFVIAPIYVLASEAYSIDYNTGTAIVEKINGENASVSFTVTADKTGIQKNISMGDTKNTFTLQEIIGNETNGYWKQIENENPDIYSQYSDASERYSGDYTIVINRDGVDVSATYHIKATVTGENWKFEDKDAPVGDITYALIVDLNGGTNNGLTLISEIKGGSTFNITGSLLDEYKSKTTPPNGKILGGIEVNGTKMNVGNYIVVDGNVSVKLLWIDDVSVPVSTSYFISEGANQTYTLGSGSDVTIKASGEAATCTDVQIDGKSLSKDQYTITSGSTIAKIKSAALEKLSEGSHKVSFVYVDGTASTYIKIAKANTGATSTTTKSTTTSTNSTNTKTTSNTNTANATTQTNNTVTTSSNNPKTGDEGIAVWICLIMISIIGITKAIKYSKKI